MKNNYLCIPSIVCERTTNITIDIGENFRHRTLLINAFKAIGYDVE